MHSCPLASRHGKSIPAKPLDTVELDVEGSPVVRPIEDERLETNDQRAARAWYHHDAIAKEQELSPQEHLIFHQAQSGPVMEQLHAWLGRQFEERRVEPNSALGASITYMLRHWRS